MMALLVVSLTCEAAWHEDKMVSDKIKQPKHKV